MSIVLKCIIYFIIAILTPTIVAFLFEKLCKYKVDSELSQEDSQEKLSRYTILCKVLKDTIGNWYFTFLLYVPIYLLILLFTNLLMVNKVMWWIGVIVLGLTLLSIIPLILIFPIDLFNLFKKYERKKGVIYSILASIFRITDFTIDVIVLIYLYSITFNKLVF